MTKARITVFDTTLRDGEQSPGSSMTAPEKLRLAHELAELGVDVLEAGFAASSPEDAESVRQISKDVSGPIITALARSTKGDIEAAARALEPAEKSRIHVFIATSDIHLSRKLGITRDQCLEQAGSAVETALQYVDDVEFSAEDAMRSDLEFLTEVVRAAVAAGAKTINIPDTVGYALPDEIQHTFRTLAERVPELARCVLSTHCHDDLGLAVANSLAAIEAGARQVECTINGIGERAGNAALEEIVMALQVRGESLGYETGIRHDRLYRTSRLLSYLTGIEPQPNKAIVGRNAFAHESGIHQDGVLKSRETYEIMRAEDVGWSANRLVLGKHSGRNAFRTRLAELGVEFASEEELNDAFARFKELADKKHEIYDEDLQALVTEANQAAVNEHYRLVSMRVCSETGETPSARVTLLVDGTEQRAVADGGGPVAASFRAVEEVDRSGSELLLYSVNAITSGTDAQGEVTVRLQRDGRIVNGQGADTDIVIASVKAYLNALNNLTHETPRRHPQGGDV